MNRHRLLLLVSALCFIAFGVYKGVAAHGREDWRRHVDTHSVMNSYLPRVDDGQRYAELYDLAVGLQDDCGALRVNYSALMGGASAVIGLMIIAVLLDTRKRKPKPTPPGP